jgi:ribose/xylose/arabinose/galactoside ABC-type transport system permease subunit/ABC-type sugar transport system substrate-binding protein
MTTTPADARRASLAAGGTRRAAVLRLLNSSLIAAALIVLIVIFSLLSPRFLSTANILTIFDSVAVIATLAIGQTFVIVTAGIDLSQGSVIALTGVLGAQAMGGHHVFLGIVVAVLIGLAVGVFNGVVVAFTKIPAFIVTLGTLSICSGAAQMITGGQPIYRIPGSLANFGTAYVGVFPLIILVTIVLAVIGQVVLGRTRFGRSVYAIGSSRPAALLSGLPVRRNIVLVYVLSGLMSGIGAVLLTAYVNTALPTAGTDYELYAIAAVVIGGGSLFGGQGAVWASMLGALLLSVLAVGTQLLGMSTYSQTVILGAVVLVAVYVDSFRKRVAVLSSIPWECTMHTLRCTVAAAGLTLLLAACSVSHSSSNGGSGSTGSTTTSGSGSKTVEFIASEDSTPYFLQEYQGVKQAAAKYGYKTVYQAPPAISDISTQIGMVSTAISDKVNGLILVPSSPTALVAPAKQAEKAGIPVVATDSNLNSGSRTYISVPDQTAADAVAKYAAGLVNGKGQYAIIDYSLSTSSGIQRRDGFEQGMKNYPGMKFDGLQISGGVVETALQETTTLLERNPGLNVIFGANDRSALGVAEAVQRLHLQNKVAVVGFDADLGEINYIKSGVLKGSMLQSPVTMGYDAVLALRQAWAGKTLPSYEPLAYHLVTYKNYSTPASVSAIAEYISGYHG